MNILSAHILTVYRLTFNHASNSCRKTIINIRRLFELIMNKGSSIKRYLQKYWPFYILKLNSKQLIIAILLSLYILLKQLKRSQFKRKKSRQDSIHIAQFQQQEQRKFRNQIDFGQFSEQSIRQVSQNKMDGDIDSCYEQLARNLASTRDKSNNQLQEKGDMLFFQIFKSYHQINHQDIEQRSSQHQESKVLQDKNKQIQSKISHQKLHM